MTEPDKPEQTPQPQQPPPPQQQQQQYPPPGPGGYPGGYPPPPPQPYAGYTPPAAAPKNGLGIAALVVAIIGLLTVFGGIILGVVAVILGVLGLGRVKRGEADNRGVAIAGIVLGVLGILVSIAVIAVAVWGFNEVGGGDLLDCVADAGSNQAEIERCNDQFRGILEDQFSITLTPTP